MATRRNTLNEYLHHLNTLHKQLKFTLTCGKKFQSLDLIITLNPWNTIHTETYEPTDTFQYLQADSYHPASTIQNIPKSQLLRHVRNCSTPCTLFSHASSLVFKLTKRNNRKQIFKKFETLRHTTRSKALNYTRKIPTGRTSLIVTYNKNLPDLKKRNAYPTPTETQKYTTTISLQNETTTIEVHNKSEIAS